MASDIEERKAKRNKYLTVLYELVDGQINGRAHNKEIAVCMKLPIEEVDSLSHFATASGWAIAASDQGLMRITAHGISMAEELLS